MQLLIAKIPDMDESLTADRIDDIIGKVNTHNMSFIISYHWNSYLSVSTYKLIVCLRRCMTQHIDSRHTTSKSAGARPGRTGRPGNLAFARWAGWSATPVGRYVKCGNRERNGGAGALSQGGIEGFTSINYFQPPPPEVLVSPLLTGAVCLISQGRFEKLVRTCARLRPCLPHRSIRRDI